MKIKSISVSYPIGKDFLTSNNIKGLNIGCSVNGFTLYNDTHYIYTDILELNDDTISDKDSVFKISDKFIYLKHDATKKYPFEDETFQWIYSEHFIEHINPSEFFFLLKELKRLLKKGGIIRCSTPDLTMYITGYMDPEKLFFREHKENIIKAVFPETLYSIEDNALEKEIEVRASVIKNYDPDIAFDTTDNTEIINDLKKSVQNILTRPAAMINQLFYVYDHKYIYDFKEITHWAKKAGFADHEIALVSFRKGKDKRLSFLDMDLRKDESLYFELYKL
jgi:SAM-dependent methyltransferase